MTIGDWLDEAFDGGGQDGGGGHGGGHGGFGIPPEDLFGPKDITTTNKVIPPDFLMPLLERYSPAFLNVLFGDRSIFGESPWPDKQFPGFGKLGRMAEQQGIESGQMGRSLMGPAAGLAQKTMRGDFLSPESNPYLQATYDKAARGVSDQYRDAIFPSKMGEFARQGSFGGSAMGNEMMRERYGLGRNLQELATDIFGGNYQQERGRQMQQQQLLPSIMRTGLAGPRFLADLGGVRRGYEKSRLENRFQNEMRDAQWPFQALDIMRSGASAGFPFGGSQTGPNPNYTSPFQALLGLDQLGGGSGVFGAGFGAGEGGLFG